MRAAQIWTSILSVGLYISSASSNAFAQEQPLGAVEVAPKAGRMSQKPGATSSLAFMKMQVEIG